jgi:hypothetical protein
LGKSACRNAELDNEISSFGRNPPNAIDRIQSLATAKLAPP